MESIGIEFTKKDGSKESFDPVNAEKPFEKEGDLYLIKMHTVYEVKVEEVESFRFYELCSMCGQETTDSGCSNYHCLSHVK